MPIDSQTLFSWVTVIAVAISVLLGLVMISTVCRSCWKSLAIGTMSVAFAFIGAVLVTTPKWTQIAIDWGDVKVRIAKAEKLEAQFGSLTAERETLAKQVAGMTQIVESQNVKLTKLAAQNTALVSQNQKVRAGLENTIEKTQASKTQPWLLEGAIGDLKQTLQTLQAQ